MLQTSRRTPLGVAVGAGHDAIVALLLNHGAKLDDSEEQQKWSQLDYPAVSALLAGHESTLALLLEWGAQTEGPNLLFGGLINCAVASGQMPMLKLLIKFGVDLNIEVNGVYPLNWAVRRIPNYASMVEVLLDNGADIALVDDDKGHLLREAIGYGTIETLHLLLKRGVSYHESLFNFAINKCTVETVRLLLDYGARIEFESVVCAVRSRNCDILELLIDHGFDLNGRDSNGCTILHRAVCREPPFKTRTICGLSANSRVSLFPKRSSPLHVAAYCRRRRDERSTTEEIVKCLIRRGADVNARARQRQTPLYWAWKYASPAVQQLLLENGADWTDMLTIY
ncbi:uncharacterized protein N7479_006433 [Penicillium vulpinum]|nr:uncharacterized protein N7479_006433 [Penicillium vulpinum]KAJ5959283.1 hypothetical protein N7479_006433 [Penicillium vulpinum]